MSRDATHHRSPESPSLRVLRSWRALGLGVVALVLMAGSIQTEARWPGTRTHVKLELMFADQTTAPLPDGASVLAGVSTADAPNQWGIRASFVNASTGAPVQLRAEMKVYETASCWTVHQGSILQTGDRTFAFKVPRSACSIMVEVRPVFPNSGVTSFYVHAGLSTEDETGGLHSPPVKIAP
jgi:hypothetical protein